MLTLGGNLNVYRFNEVPHHFQEHFILDGYRKPPSSLRQCVRSIFASTNETINFWTHFLPAVYFLYVFVTLVGSRGLADQYVWPLYIFLVGCCLYLLGSAFAHTFNILSDHARHVCFFFDYAGLSLYSLSSAIAYRAYSFPVALQDTAYSDWYVHIATANAIGGLLLCCETRFQEANTLYKIVRMSSFGLPYIFDTVPIMYRVLYCTPEECSSTGLPPHFRQFVWITLAAFFFASHFPERLYPGKFDIYGHSHQLFHVLGAVGTYEQMSALFADAWEREEQLSGTDRVLPAISSVVPFVIACLVSLLTIYSFVLKMERVGADKMQKISNCKAE